MAFYNTQAIILTSQNYGEADRILTLLSYERGRMRCITKGSRRPRNRFAALAQPLNLIEAQLSGSTGLENLTQAQLVKNYRIIREDLDKLAYASYLLELFDKATEGASDAAEVFLLLMTALEMLQYSEDLRMVCLYIELKLLAAIGFFPHIKICVKCQLPIDKNEPLGYNIVEGGVCCSKCFTQESMLPFSIAGRNLMADCLSIEPHHISQVETDEATLNQVREVARESLRNALGDLPRSIQFLDTVTGDLSY